MTRKENKPTYTPRVDALETPNEVILHADLPGAGAGTMDVRYENGVLGIHGKVRDREDGRTHTLLCEYDTGGFRRSFELGERFDVDAMTADLSEGVLTIRLPKKAAAKPRPIDVNPDENPEQGKE